MTVRKLIAALAAIATALGLALVLAPAAQAAMNSPSVNGQVVTGFFTAQLSGATKTAVGDCPSQPTARITLLSGGTTLQQQQYQGDKPANMVINTHNYPNGVYTVTGFERNVIGLFGACAYTGSTTNTSRTIEIRNTLSVTYTGATSAPQNTTVAVSAKVIDPNKTPQDVAGIPVTFSLTDSAATAVGVTNAAGVATANLPVNGPPGARTVSATTQAGAGFNLYPSASGSSGFTLTKNASSTTLDQPADVVHGNAVTFTANVARSTGTSEPTGTVQFTLDGSPYGAPVSVSSSGAGVASATTPVSYTIPTGSHTVGATYSGDGNLLSSGAATRSFSVTKAASTVVVTGNPGSPTKFGQSTTFTATVDKGADAGPGSVAPTGEVQFFVNGSPFGTAVALTGATAQFSISTLAAQATHSIEARYSGDGNYKVSDSAPYQHAVDQADTNVAVTSSAPGAVSGQSVSWTATVTAVAPGSGVPVPGTVQFYVNGNALGGPVTLSGAGTATSPVTNLPKGAYTITANYSGNSNYGGATGTYAQTVAIAQTTTSVTSSPNPSVFGQNVTLRAEVSPVAPATGTPVGVVRFVVDGATIANVDLEAGDNGVVEYVTNTLTVGSHPVRAEFLIGAGSNFEPSSSGTITQVVNKANTTTTLTSDNPTSVFGQQVTFTAAVSVNAPGAGSPSGTITFADGSTELATVPVNSGTGFQATFSTDDLSVGQHAITATYSGDGSFNGSNDSATQVVMKASTSTVVVSSANPALTGQPVSFSATVTPVAPGAGAPSGTVVFKMNGVPFGGSRPVVDGVATSPDFVALTPGTYKVEASYSGDGNFLKSSGLLDQGTGQSVNRGATTASLAVADDTIAFNDTATFTATVSAVAPAVGKPTGVVRFWEGSTLLGSSSLVPGSGSTSAATFSYAAFAPGGHAVRAEYVGNFNFAASEALASVTVDRAPTVTGVESSANPVTFGDSVTLTAVVGKAIPAPGKPTGTVTFKEGSNVLGTATLATNGGRQSASITVPNLGGGAHAITAVYGGDVSFSGSTSPTFTQNVAQQAVTLKAGHPNDGPQYIDTRNGYVRAQLFDADGDPLAGQLITFRNEPFQTRPAYVLCTAVTDATGLAECDHTAINIDPSLSGDDLLIDVNGRYSANFAGSGNYLPAVAQGATF